MIEFEDGTEMSWEEAAVMIEAEGRLITHSLRNFDDERCAIGVLQDVTRDGQRYFNNARVNDGSSIDQLIKENNAFEGTPEERAVYMASWLREQGA